MIGTIKLSQLQLETCNIRGWIPQFAENENIDTLLYNVIVKTINWEQGSNSLDTIFTINYDLEKLESWTDFEELDERLRIGL